MSLNNSVWLDPGLSLQPTYQSAVQSYYGAQARPLTPVADSGGAGTAVRISIQISQAGRADVSVSTSRGPAAAACSSAPGGSPAPSQPCLLLDTRFAGGAPGAGKLTAVTATVAVNLIDGSTTRGALILANALVFSGLWAAAFPRQGHA